MVQQKEVTRIAPQIERVWAMPSPWTFTIKPIAQLLKEEMAEGGLWVDPFAGKNSPAQVRNDINPNRDAEFHMDALEFLTREKDEQYDGVILDWPYNLNQYTICYHEAGLPVNKAVYNARYQSSIKNHLGRILKPGGKAICFGWNSMGLGLKRGFELRRILLVAHGRMHNDTIVTVETKGPKVN